MTTAAVEPRRVRWSTLGSYVPFALIPVLFLVGVATIEGYATRPSVMSLLVLASLLGIASLGQTVAVIVGAIDLSIPATIGMADVVLTQLYGRTQSFATCLVVILVLAVAIGLLNAVASQLLQVHPLIVTLGTGLIVSGAVLVWSNGAITGTVPEWLVTTVSPVGRTGPLPVPAVVLLWLVATVLTVLGLRNLRLGREIYATGANPSAARLALVRSGWARTATFCLSAICAAVVGILFAGYSGQAEATVGDPYMFQTITAVVVGGTSLLGGRGGYGRTVAGTLIITQLTALLVGFGFGPSMQQAFLGLLIVVLVVVYGRERHVSEQI